MQNKNYIVIIATAVILFLLWKEYRKRKSAPIANPPTLSLGNYVPKPKPQYKPPVSTDTTEFKSDADVPSASNTRFDAPSPNGNTIQVQPSAGGIDYAIKGKPIPNENTVEVDPNPNYNSNSENTIKIK